MKNIVNIVWFKRDLRLSDHQPLEQAAQTGALLPLYIVEPEYFKLADVSRRHWCFIFDSLQSVDDQLNKIGARLVIRIGAAVDVLESIRARYGKIVLWSHQETGNAWTYERDKKVSLWCKTYMVPWHETPSGGVVRCLKSRNGWSKSRDEIMTMPVADMPSQVRMLSDIVSDQLPSKSHALFGSAAIGKVQIGGRKAALDTLNSFLNTRAISYLRVISKPGYSEHYCSRISTHLTYGTLSTREVEQAVRQRLRTLDSVVDESANYWRRNLMAFTSRLAWRCHFIQKLEQQPEIEFQSIHPAFEGMREPHHRDDFLEAWKSGHTGYPIIDACMRALHINGWITFRMRALVVSFASYHLWLDWRQTAPFLAQLFTDYEPGIHYSQLQMQSGVTGINALRIYNPIKQSLDHDPKGNFIKTYVPELRHISEHWIHQPWLNGSGPDNYPKPIVDHLTAVKRARLEISSRWKTTDFRTVARSVNDKLGSRKKRGTRTSKKVTERDDRQLDFDF
jgi:deoxyribodipyrimidine photo-lyase